ncbi:MAG TPA: adenylate/guanylate cyclase domain-containing protein [bacterium]
MGTCPHCGTENPHSARFCMTCGGALASDRPAPESRKTVTVVFSDVAGSTTLGEQLDPELIRLVMTRYFDAMKAVLEHHGGTVEKFIGDAIMAVFGIPVLHEDDALRAVRAASAMRGRLTLLNKELAQGHGISLAVRIGVNTGEVVTGDPASGQRLVTGDAVNLASRLEQAAAPGQVLLGESTYRLIRNAVQAEPVGPLSVKGKSTSVQAFRLIAVSADTPQIERRFRSPMVARERQLGMLVQAFQSAGAERRCYLFTVLGAAGVGKSRLIYEFRQGLPPGTSVLQGRCLSYGEGITFWPVTELLREAAGLREDHSSEERRARIAALLAGEEHVGPIADRLAELLGVGKPSAAPQETFWAVRRLLESLGKRQPLVVIFDDIHWAEPTLLDLVEYVADWTRDSALLLICTSRLELLDRRQGWGGGKLNATSILLEPLHDQECEHLINNLLGTRLPADVSQRILKAAEGIPLFVEQMIGMLIDEGLLRRDNGSWIPAGDLSRVQVPPTIHALLAARLDQVHPDERTVVECGAVEGKVFHLGALAELAPEAIRGRLGTLLMSLTRRELIRTDRAEFVGEEAFRFRHQLIRDAAYNGMPKGQRAKLHERFATWLEGVVGGTSEYEEVLGFHLEQAYRYKTDLGSIGAEDQRLARRAASLLGAAGHRAMTRGDMPGAANLLERAIALREAEPERVEAMLLLSRVLIELGELRRAESLVKQALEEARAIGGEGLQMHARIARARIIGSVDPDAFVTEAEATARKAIPLFERLGDDSGLAHSWELVASRLNQIGHPKEMKDAYEKAIEHARRAGDWQGELANTPALASTLFWGATPVEEGIRRLAAMLDRVRGHRLVEARINRYLAGFVAMQGRIDEARKLARGATTTFQELGAKLALATQGSVIGTLEFLAGEPAAAEREVRASCEALERMGERAWYCSLAAFLAETLYLQGRYDEAYGWTVRSEQTAGAGDLEAQADLRAVRAKILARRGEFAEAERLAREAIEIGRPAEEIDHDGDYYFDLAEVLRLAGRTAAAADALQNAIQLWTLKGNVVSASKGRATLASLASEG